MRALTPQQRVEVQWWKSTRRLVRHAPRCMPGHECPDCRQGDPCPLDVSHEYAARSLLVTPDGEISDDRIVAISIRGGGLVSWADSVPELAGHLAWLCMQHFVRTHQQHRADAVLGMAEMCGLHRHEPWLAIQVAQLKVGRGDLDDAIELLGAATDPPTSNPSQLAVAGALTRLRAYRADLLNPRSSRNLPAPNGTAPRGRFRPVARVRRNPYRVSEYGRLRSGAARGHELTDDPGELA